MLCVCVSYIVRNSSKTNAHSAFSDTHCVCMCARARSQCFVETKHHIRSEVHNFMAKCRETQCGIESRKITSNGILVKRATRSLKLNYKKNVAIKSRRKQLSSVPLVFVEIQLNRAHTQTHYRVFRCSLSFSLARSLSPFYDLAPVFSFLLFVIPFTFIKIHSNHKFSDYSTLD